MKAIIEINNNSIQVDLSKPIDISLAVKDLNKAASAWNVGSSKIEPVVRGDWIGSVAAGAAVNFNNIHFNPHGNGTHTECIGHISREFHSINQCLTEFFFLAELISVSPQIIGNDKVISRQQIKEGIEQKDFQAIIIRTLPNNDEKKTRNYSNTNPAYLAEEATSYIREKGIRHLLIDLPSVDKEKDDGKLLSHKAFWDYEGKQLMDATITELIYVPNDVSDGSYLLNLQIASFENDASPSKPVLYRIEI